ncbi:hypothetical protein H0H81_001809 [Sphagnurus paluster]|uniref:Protein kinase domain-containing protein n=1 Tax=Sphagnurus paluster TaxID=117069 RepID=A0A9P7GM50_9AGAR|nr:hypothetical protein H0H81_001809 [Sphagnurus paluster]
MQRPENEPSAKLKRMKKALCNFYTLIEPVNAEDDILDIPEIMASLQDTTKYKKVRNMAVSKIAKKFNNDFLYLVIEDLSAEGMDEAEDEDDLGIFGDDKIVANLAEMDCKVAYVVFGPVMKQLFEAVKFMHDNYVAHMDLKPSNLLIPSEYGTLTVIDFGVSVRVKKLEQLFQSKSRVGTEGYIAPEVGRTKFSPIRADLWSVGKVVEEFFTLCRPSACRDWLLCLSKRLLDDDLKQRPMMAEVLQEMLNYSVMVPYIQQLRCFHVAVGRYSLLRRYVRLNKTSDCGVGTLRGDRRGLGRGHPPLDEGDDTEALSLVRLYNYPWELVPDQRGPQAGDACETFACPRFRPHRPPTSIRKQISDSMGAANTLGNS